MKISHLVDCVFTLSMALRACLLIGFLAAFASTSSGQTSIWTNTTGSPSPYYSGSFNWSTSSHPGPSGTARFDAPLQYEVWWDSITQVLAPSVGQVYATGQTDVLFESQTGFQHRLQIGGGQLYDLHLTGNSTLTLEGIHLDVVGNAWLENGADLILDGNHPNNSWVEVSQNLELTNSAAIWVNGGSRLDANRMTLAATLGPGFLNVDGAGSTATINSAFEVGKYSYGRVNLSNGALLTTNTSTFMGDNTNPKGEINLSDNSTWNNNSTIYVGYDGVGELNVMSGSDVTTARVEAGWDTDGKGDILVSGNGSSITTSGNSILGDGGEGTLSVLAGGKFQSGGDLFIGAGFSASGDGTANVDGDGSHLEILQDLYVGGSSNGLGIGQLTITNGGKVSVSGQSNIWNEGTVSIDGGTFEFGQMNYDHFKKMNVTAGTLAGMIQLQGYQNASTFAHFNNASIDVSGVDIENGGTLSGQQEFGGSLTNQASGEIEVLSGERMRFAGVSNSNAGEISNYGGIVRFDQDLTNEANGFVSGRGQFVANGGWTNHGVMAFSAGPADVIGDVDNQSGGRIVTAGGATTTFYDDVVHNGTEIHTAAGSNTVFFGSQSGAGAFTGTGTVFYVGDLRPGNSPAAVSYEGSVVLGSTVETFIELAGMDAGEFDQFLIADDLDLDGSLNVQLIDGFQLTFNDEFLIAEVGGQLNGQFSGLDEGALVGNYGGHDLFISYSAGDGNDVGLFTAIPEPGPFSALFMIAAALTSYRLRRRAC